VESSAACARLIARAGVALSCLIAFAAPARAQLEVNELELQMRPVAASPITQTIVVRNPGAAATTAQLHLEDWDRLENGTNRFLRVGTGSGTCGPRLSVFPASLSLGPGQSQTVRVTWTPDGAAAAATECWGIVFIEQPPPPRRAGTGLVLQVRTGVKVYVTPPGLTRSAAIARLALLPGAQPRGARPLLVSVRNDGAVHFEASARVEIRRPDDTVADSLTLPMLYALPGAVATVGATLPALAPGRYVLLLFVDYGAPDLLAGQLEIDVPG
jgi:P pilus assembly chaperone PapD